PVTAQRGRQPGTRFLARCDATEAFALRNSERALATADLAGFAAEPHRDDRDLAAGPARAPRTQLDARPARRPRDVQVRDEGALPRDAAAIALLAVDRPRQAQHRAATRADAPRGRGRADEGSWRVGPRLSLGIRSPAGL